MKLNDRQRSMIASAFVGAFGAAPTVDENKRRSLCCAPDAIEACKRIVGSQKAAEKLRSFFYESLGCCGWPSDPEYQELQEQYFVDKIAELETL